jgi:hypothetical protein
LHSGDKKAFSLIFRMHPYQGYPVPVPEAKVSTVEIDATKIAARAKA